MNITPVIISKNAMRTIAQTLNSLHEFDEIIVLDTGSSDNTMDIARQYKNVKLFQGDFYGFGKSKNEAAKLASNDWILSIDSDEVLTPELLHSLRELVLDNNFVFRWKRSNFYRNKVIKYSGWGNDFLIRLYNKKTTRFKEKLVHEYVESAGLKIATLSGNMNHYSYCSISEFSRKREFYSDLFAVENKGKRKSSPFNAFLHASFDFLNTYIIKRGFLDGYIGLLIAVSNAYVSFLKYIKLHEANLELAFAKKSTLPIAVFKSTPLKNQNSSKRVFALELVQPENDSLTNSDKIRNSVLFMKQ